MYIYVYMYGAAMHTDGTAYGTYNTVQPQYFCKLSEPFVRLPTKQIGNN